jgi:hypothetical protein
MKILITESKVNDIILKYLKDNIEPDYSWGPELHDFYKEDVARHGYYDFTINDSLSYSYWLEDDYTGRLEVMPRVYDELDGLFGHMWEDLFVEWFEKNSGLKVDLFDRYDNSVNDRS